MTQSRKCLVLSIAGRVQGVAFRAWTAAEARRRGLTGWVQNEADGTVSALIDGPADAVDEMLDALHKGPPAARVDRVNAMPAAGCPDPGFEIRQ